MEKQSLIQQNNPIRKAKVNKPHPKNRQAKSQHKHLKLFKCLRYISSCLL